MVTLPDNPFLVWCEGRIRKNKNCMILVNGATGGGKSYSCISLGQQLAERLGTSFSVHKNLAFNFTTLLEKMNLPENQKPGTVFIFEETGSVGSGSAARQWQSKTNLFFNSFAQTARHRNQILFMNCPNFSNLEKATRMLIHFQLECQFINFEQQVCYLKPFCIQINSRTGKTYFKYLRVKYDGKTIKFNRMIVSHPGKKVSRDYEAMKLKFTSELNQMIIDSEKKPEHPRKKIDELRLQELLNQGLGNTEIARMLGVHRKTIWETIKNKRLKRPKKK